MNKFTSIDELPLSLTVQDIADIMGLSLAKAYELCHSKGFPSVLVGRRIIIMKPAFVAWMQNPKQNM